MRGDRPERWTAVLNPAAGRGRGPSRVARAREALAASGLDVDVHVTASMDDLARVAGEGFARGHGVVACGGDGTAGVAADGDVAEVDLGRAETADAPPTWFTTVAGTGFDAEANRWANTRSHLTGTPLYVLAVLRTLRAYRPTPVRITVDGTVTETEAWLVAAANTRTYAGGMLVAPAASMHDGLLDVCVVGPVSRAGFLRAFPGVFRGTHLHHPMITMQRGRDVAIELLDARAGTPAPELWASGERVGALPTRLTARSRALRVVVGRAIPPGADVAPT